MAEMLIKYEAKLSAVSVLRPSTKYFIFHTMHARLCLNNFYTWLTAMHQGSYLTCIARIIVVATCK